MLKISPVPWTIYEKTHVMSGERLVANTGGYSANIDSDKVIEENMANAQFVAAAPKLYEALVKIGTYPALSPLSPIMALDDMRRIAREAIGQADGE